MSLAMTGVVEMADTVFLCSAAVVDLMQQVGVGECGECAEEGRAVNRGQCLYQVLQVESVIELVAHMSPYQQTDGSHAHACIVE